MEPKKFDRNGLSIADLSSQTQASPTYGLYSQPSVTDRLVGVA